MSDREHLISLITMLGNEMARLNKAKTDTERKLRTVWVDQLIKEIKAEEAFLGLKPMEVLLSDDDLFNALCDGIEA